MTHVGAVLALRSKKHHNSHLVVAKQRFVDNHDQRFSKPQHFKASSSPSMRDHKVCTFHILKNGIIEFQDDNLDRYPCQGGLVGPGIGCEGKTGWDLHLAGSCLICIISRLWLVANIISLLIIPQRDSHLNFHLIVAHVNKQAGDFWINCRGNQLRKFGRTHSHQHPHLYCWKVASTDFWLCVTDRSHFHFFFHSFF